MTYVSYSPNSTAAIRLRFFSFLPSIDLLRQKGQAGSRHTFLGEVLR